MDFFSKREAKIVSIILGTIFLFSFLNFRASFRKARDAQRKDDVRDILVALDTYSEVGGYPLAQDGKILACFKEGDNRVKEDGTFNFIPCRWGEDALKHPFDDSQVFTKRLPVDPQNDESVSYLYLSNGKRVQIFASLEGENQDEFNQAVFSRNLACGVRTCNFGRASGDTPLETSIETYENQLEREND